MPITDLPDWMTQVSGIEAEAYTIRGGADAAKSASPTSKDVYLATDTKKLYVCVADGAWTGFDASILVQGILTLYADMVGGGFEITGIKDPTAAQSAATRAYVLAQTVAYLLLTGGTMSGAIAMGSNKITGLAAPTAATDAARKTEVDTVDGKLDDVTQAQPTRVLGTTYQNTGGKIRIVTVTLDQTTGSSFTVECDTNATPTTDVASSYGDGTSSQIQQITFVVPPSYYYRVRRLAGADEILYWTEWDLH